jgi:hypothetical protein
MCVHAFKRDHIHSVLCPCIHTCIHTYIHRLLMASKTSQLLPAISRWVRELVLLLLHAPQLQQVLQCKIGTRWSAGICMCVCVSVYAGSYVCIHMYIYTHIYIYMSLSCYCSMHHICNRRFSAASSRIHVYIHEHIHTYRLQYLQQELEEAQAALSRKHMQQQVIVDRYVLVCVCVFVLVCVCACVYVCVHQLMSNG